METLNLIKEGKENIWINENYSSVELMSTIAGLKFVEVRAAQNRLMRFAPLIAKVFPETETRKGVIESELIPISNMKEALNKQGANITGSVFAKNDGYLPIAGSVKARGGIYEVLKHAEELAMKAGLLKATDDYSMLARTQFKEFFGKYTIQVGSTGNLGISIGMMGAKLGFNVIVHMSKDAKDWKKQLLRNNNVTVIEYEDNYSYAVAEGRKQSDLVENSYFIDDENSKDLFMGYSTAAMRLKVQLFKAGIAVDKDHPLFVYLPCGVGGAPGGITFGLKQMFGDSVHCFFAEPTQAPCAMLGFCEKEKYQDIYEISLSGKTEADGLAVGRVSDFVLEHIKGIVSGCGTVTDENMSKYQKLFYETEKIFAEVSGCAGFGILDKISRDTNLNNYLDREDLLNIMDEATHIVWVTGGGLVPKEEREHMLGGQND